MVDHDRIAFCLTLSGVMLAFPTVANAQRMNERLPEVAWLRDLATTPGLAKDRPDSGRYGSASKVTFRIPDSVPPHTYMKHVFGLLAPDSSAALYMNQGISDSLMARLLNATDTSRVATLNTEQFLRIVSNLRSMRNNSRLRIPAASAMRDQAMQHYRLSGQVPIGIIDVDVYSLGVGFSDDIGVTRDGRFVSRSPVRHSRKRLFVAAPLISSVPASNVILVINDRFTIREADRSQTPRYELSINGRRVRPDRNGALAIRLDSSTTALTLVNPVGLHSASSCVKRTRLIAPQAADRLALLRKLKAAQGERQFLKLWASGRSTRASFTVGENESWTPEVGGVHAAQVYSPDTWGGIEIGVWWSASNSAVDPANRVIEPLIIVGGQDRPTTEPQSLYLLLRDRLGDEALNLLRQRFDIFVFGFWAGGSNDDCSDPAGNAVECRAQSIERPIMDNAAFVADAMRFIYSHYGIQKKATVIGISMGGVVTRAAFLGIENGPIQHLGVDAFKSIPGFANRTVPVRVWITLDSPHQGAYIPLGVQSWVSSVSWLPGMELNTRLLEAPSSRELLREHHTASENCVQNCAWYEMPRGPRTARAAAPERTAMINTLSSLGAFPKTVDTSIAVASGSFEMPRAHLWKLDGAGKIPLTLEACFNDECVSLPPGSTGNPALDAAIDLLTYPVNNFDVAWPGIAAVANPSQPYLTGYWPVAPHALPLHAIDVKVFTMRDSDKKIEGRFYSLMAEVSHDPASIPQVVEPEEAFDIENGGSLEKVKLYRSRLAFGVTGEFKVNIAGFSKWVDISIGGSMQKWLPTSRKPLAFEVGGFRNTVGDIDAALTDAFGAAISAPFAPRHSFVSTVSAMDLQKEFLENAYKTRVQSASVDAERYGRGKDRGSFHENDYLDWKPFQTELEVRGSDCVYTSGPRNIRLSGTTIWSGTASPFTYVVCQSQSLEHTFIEEKAALFLLERIFNEPSRFTGIPPKVNFNVLPDIRLDRLPPILPPSPWPDDFEKRFKAAARFLSPSRN